MIMGLLQNGCLYAEAYKQPFELYHNTTLDQLNIYVVRK